MRIELHIERLVLEGVSPAQAAGLREDLQAELSRLLTEAPQRCFPQSRHQRSLRVLAPRPGAGDQYGRSAVTGSAVTGSGITGSATAMGIARSVFEAVSRAR